jgi:hypothetical protein
MFQRKEKILGFRRVASPEERNQLSILNLEEI